MLIMANRMQDASSSKCNFNRTNEKKIKHSIALLRSEIFSHLFFNKGLLRRSVKNSLNKHIPEYVTARN
jgi:hypothetical protein